MTDDEVKQKALNKAFAEEVEKKEWEDLIYRTARRNNDAKERPPQNLQPALTPEELFKMPHPQYLVDRLIPAQGLIQVVGFPGTLKSFFMLDVGLTVASGAGKFFGYATAQGPVLYIVAEGAGAFQFRMRAWCTEHEVDPFTLPIRIIPSTVDLRDAVFQAHLTAIVAELRPVLIVVDTLSRCTPGADENSSRDMGQAVNFCTTLAATGVAVVLVHHPAKGDPSGGGRGSSVVVGALDTALYVATPEEEAGENDVQASRDITVECTKQKDDAQPPTLKLTGHVVEVKDQWGQVMTYESGRIITSLVLRATPPADAKEQIDKVRTAEYKLDVEVLRIMAEHQGATSVERLRDYMPGGQRNKNVVAESVRRILLLEWAKRGPAGKPYVILEAGKQVLHGSP